MISPQPIIQDPEVVLDALRDLLGRYPLAANCGPESLAKHLFVMRYLDVLPSAFALETAREALQLEGGELAA